METIRTLLTAAFLAAVTLGAYYYINTPSEDREKAVAALFGQSDDAQTEANTAPPFVSTYNPSNDSSQNSNFSSEYSENSSSFNKKTVSQGAELSSDGAFPPIPVNPFDASNAGNVSPGQDNTNGFELPGLPDANSSDGTAAANAAASPVNSAMNPGYSSPEIASSDPTSAGTAVPGTAVAATSQPYSPELPSLPGMPSAPGSEAPAPAAPVAPAIGSSAAGSMAAQPIPPISGDLAGNQGASSEDAYKAQQEQQNRAMVQDFLQKASSMIQNGERLAVLTELSKWYNNSNFTEQEKQQLNLMLMKLAGEIIYLHPEKHLTPAYTVQPGDTITSLAQKYQVPWQFLAKINGLRAPFLLPTGTSLKVVKGPFNAEVNMEKFEMTLWLPLEAKNPQESPSSIYAGTFHIGLGQDTPRLGGDYIVEEKLLDPEYRVNDAVFAPNDPNNPYGARLIKLVQYGNPHMPRIGIHGTNNSANVRQLTSRGNICLDARDINDLFDILSIGSRVLIKERDK